MKIEFKNIYIHFVLTVYKRQKHIMEVHRNRIEKYITGIISRYDSKLYAIYANPEHVHILISIDPTCDPEHLVTEIADSSEKFINKNLLHPHNAPFHWQQSCSAFSISHGHVDRIAKYIMNQPEHHRRKTWSEEYDEFVRYFQSSLDPRV